MTLLRTVTAALVLSGLAGAALPAQQEEPAPAPRPHRMQMHAPGTGMRGGMMPGAMMQGRMRGRMMGHRMMGVGQFGPRALLARRQFLQLSDAQVAELEKLSESVRQTEEQAREQLKQHQDALRELWAADEPDVDAIRRHAEAAQQARQQVSLAWLTTAARAKALLSPEQRGKIRGMMEGRRAAMHHRPGMGRGMHMRRPGMRRPPMPQ